MSSQQQSTRESSGETTGAKRAYHTPRLTSFGALRAMTQTGTGSASESSGTNVMNCTDAYMSHSSCFTSDRNAKQNIVRIGTHPLGIGLYLFDYKPAFRDQWGHGRQFGVMADEVENVVPDAVATFADGYKRVNYAMLGIVRNVH